MVRQTQAVVPGKVFSVYRLLDFPRAVEKLKQSGYVPRRVNEKFSGVTLLTFNLLKPGKPDWYRLLATVAVAESEITNLETLSPAFALFVECDSATYVTCAGSASKILQSFIDSDFGLEVAPKLIRKKRIKVDRAKMPTGPYEELQATHRDSYELSSRTGVSARITNEILGRAEKTDIELLTGIKLTNKRGVIVHAGAGIEIRRKLTFEELLSLVRAIDKEFPSHPDHFKITDGMERVATADQPRLWQELLRILQQAYADFLLESFEEESVGLSLPKSTDLLDLHHFVVTFRKPVRSDAPFDLFTVFECLRSVGLKYFTDSTLNTVRISCYTQTGDPIEEDLPLRSFLAAFIGVGSKDYALINAKWYLVDSDYVAWVKEQVSEMVEAAEELSREWVEVWGRSGGKLVAEDDWIGAVGDKDGVHVLHRDHIHLDGQNAGELCDILHLVNSKGYLHFVKRGLGVQVRELCSQAKVAMFQLRRRNDYIKEALCKLSSRGLMVGTEELRSFVPVLSVCDYKHGRAHLPLLQRLTFLAQLELAETRRNLGEQGFHNVVIHEIPSADT